MALYLKTIGLNMKKFLALFMAAVIAFVSPFPVYAGYAQLKLPGWSPPKTPGTPATFKTGPAANENTYRGSTVVTNASLDVGGQAIKVPVSMRIAANAATIGATFAFGNPAIFAALTVTSAAYLYYQQQGLTVDGGRWVQEVGCPTSPCYVFKFSGSGGAGGSFVTTTTHPTAPAAVTATIALMPTDGGKYSYRFNTCNGIGTFDCSYIITKRTYINEGAANQTTSYTDSVTGGTLEKFSVPPTGSTKVPVTEADFHKRMDPVPVPKLVPQELPDVEWPYEQPALNPDKTTIPDTFPSPATAPASRPFWFPTGDPVKNPNPTPSTTPDTWTQPGKQVNPSGSPSDPWRVDVVDSPRTKTDATPNTQTDVVSTTTPQAAPAPEIVTCGLPGKPKCLIDETGTPTNADPQVNTSKSALDTTASTAAQAIDAVKTIAPPTWSFTFQLPTGCTPFVTGIAGVVLNVCSYQPIIHDLMSMIWASATAFALIGMVGRTIREA